ncbi:MAG: hypothetical protein GY730_06580 [bacterium]|nr:hypothetical protein [bacterium]
MPKKILLKKTAKKGTPESELLDDSEIGNPVVPNPQAQRDIDSQNGKTKKVKTKSQIKLSEFTRVENLPLFFVVGSGRRSNVRNLNIPIPEEIFQVIKKNSNNSSATYIALMQYALDILAKKGKGLKIENIKE